MGGGGGAPAKSFYAFLSATVSKKWKLPASLGIVDRQKTNGRTE